MIITNRIVRTPFIGNAILDKLLAEFPNQIGFDLDIMRGVG